MQLCKRFGNRQANAGSRFIISAYSYKGFKYLMSEFFWYGFSIIDKTDSKIFVCTFYSTYTYGCAGCCIFYSIRYHIRAYLNECFPVYKCHKMIGWQFQIQFNIIGSRLLLEAGYNIGYNCNNICFYKV